MSAASIKTLQSRNDAVGCAFSPHQKPNRSGRDAFHRVPNSFWKYGDAVERVPTGFRGFNVRTFCSEDSLPDPRACQARHKLGAPSSETASRNVVLQRRRGNCRRGLSRNFVIATLDGGLKRKTAEAER